MSDTDSILRRIRLGLAPRGHRKIISDMTGIHPVQLAQVLKPDWNPTANTIRVLDEAIARLTERLNAEPDRNDTDGQIIDLLGGTREVAQLLNISDSRVSNWRNRGIAWRYRPRIAEIAKRLNVSLPAGFSL